MSNENLFMFHQSWSICTRDLSDSSAEEQRKRPHGSKYYLQGMFRSFREDIRILY